MKISAKAPCRVDLAGGTLDIWPLYLYHEGAVTVNFAVSRYASCVKKTRDDSRIVLESQNVEAQIIRGPMGCQDDYPAMYSGVSAIELSPAGIERKAIPVDLNDAVASAIEREGAAVLPAAVAPRGVEVKVSR